MSIVPPLIGTIRGDLEANDSFDDKEPKKSTDDGNRNEKSAESSQEAVGHGVEK
jgi:hypothetical protein